MKAKFITLEGIEGSGKTSSLKGVTDLLDKKDVSYIVTREPGGSSIGEELRAILLDPDTKISPEVELMLMLSDRKDHVQKIILPNLEKGNWVVSDRFMDSSFAYQGGGRQLDKNLIISLAEYLNLPQPDLTLLFDLPAEISLARVMVRGKLDRFEKEELEFHNRIRKAYLDLAINNTDRIKIIDSSQKLKAMLNNVQRVIKDFFNE